MWIDDLPAFLVALTQARVAVWPALGGAGVTLAAAVRDGRRRTVLNERLHEVRRPLQVLALMTPAPAGPAAADGPLEMAAAALVRLDREINGEGEAQVWATFAMRPLLDAARRRWHGQAALTGATIEVRWDAGEAVVEGDRIDLVAALDNLIANALEHGGPRIEVIADRVGGRICLAVVDSGNGAGRRARDREAVLRGREAKRRREPRAYFGRLSGKARHGHGLRLVRRTAERHGGTFALHHGEQGTSAVLELPLAPVVTGTRHPDPQDDRDDPERTSLLFVREGSSRSSLRRASLPRGNK
ncbi:MAG TPA: HAMP domain-containing sensor histidine kinase [Solirubrobacterales bacterium]|nr:HAMP domain-containing sensor histidine kinase [Solirubrobacterales bacterium]